MLGVGIDDIIKEINSGTTKLDCSIKHTHILYTI